MAELTSSSEPRENNTQWLIKQLERPGPTYQFIEESIFTDRSREIKARTMPSTLAANMKTFHFVDDHDMDEKSERKKKSAPQRYSTAARKLVMQDNSSSSLPASHATNNVDIGLARHKSKPNIQYQLESRSPSLSTSLPIPYLGAGRSDPFIPQHSDIVQTTSTWASYLLDHLYTSPCASMVVTSRTCALWLNLDSTVFTQFLPLSALCLSSHGYGLDRALAKRDALYFNACTLASVRRRFADPEQAGGDGVVAAILDFNGASKAGWCWEQFFEMREGVDEWIIHMDGMKAVLERRGGVGSLMANAGLRRVIFAVDTQGACVRDLRPYFPIPRELLPSIDSLHLLDHHATENLQRTLRLLGTSDISKVLNDLGVLSSWIQHSATIDPSFWSRLETSLFYIMPIVHACLMLKPTATSLVHGLSSSDLILTQVLRYATILFLAPVRRAFSIITDGMALLTSNLRLALEQCPQDTWTGLEALLLWVLVAAGMECTTDSARAEPVPQYTRAWFLEEIRDWKRKAAAGKMMDITIAAIREVMRNFVWVGVVHNAPLHELMDLAFERPE